MIKKILPLQEAAWFVADECIQILGGMGYMKVSYVPFNDLERYRLLQKDSRTS